MQILNLRIIFDHPEIDVYKDIVFSRDTDWDTMHLYMLHFFGLPAFTDYRVEFCSEDWNALESYGSEELAKDKLRDLVYKKGARLRYMIPESEYSFLVECIGMHSDSSSGELPFLLDSLGELPDESVIAEGLEPGDFLKLNSGARYKEKDTSQHSESDDETEEQGGLPDGLEGFF